MTIGIADKSVTTFNLNELNSNGIELKSETDDNLKCGYGSCTPSWLQCFHRPQWLLIFLSLCSIIQGMVVNGLIPVSITTLEKRFNLNSTQTGLFSAFYDVAVLIILIPVCHWGNRGHNGRWIGCGVLLMSFGSFIIALPQFTTSPYDGGENVESICSSDPSDQSCNQNGSKLHLYLYVFLLGQIFNGFGASPLYTLGISYIDENVSQQASPVYLGIYLAASTIGPALGFVIGGMLLNQWGDIGKSDWRELGLSGPSDERWYGAWWIAFLITGVAAFLFSLPVLGYARELPGSKKHREKDVDQTHENFSHGFGEKFSDLPKSFLRLISNPTFAALIAMQTAEAFLMNGFITFTPKVFENLFSFSAAKASLIAGGIVVPMGFLGNVIGGLILRWRRMQCRNMIALALFFNCISTCLVLVFIKQCPNVPFAGVSTGYSTGLNQSESFDLLSDCNSNCNCGDKYDPVCNSQLQLSYFSACHAGCSEKEGKQLWHNCSCPQRRYLEESNADGFNSSVQSGLCKTECRGLLLFMVIFSFLVLITFCSAMPVQQAVLRCVPFQQRTMALGFQWLFMRLFGSIPGAVLFGLAIDKTCILWKSECGVQRTCLRYSNLHLSYSIFGFGITLKLLIVFFLAIAYSYYRPSSSNNSNKKTDRVKPIENEQIPTNQLELG